MSAGLLINLEKINSFGEDFNECGAIIPAINECNTKLNQVEYHYRYFGDNETFKIQRGKINDIQRALNAISNNVEDLSDGLLKYYNKMSEDEIAKESEDVFVAKDMSEISSIIRKIEEAITTLENEITREQQNHSEISNSFGMINFEKNDDGKCTIDFDKKQEVEEMKTMNREHIRLLTNLSQSIKNLDHDLEFITKDFDKIAEWYDLDFSMGDHARRVAPAIIDVVLTTGATIGITALGIVSAPELAAAAIVSGFFAVLTIDNKYEDGATAGGSLLSGATSFGWNMLTAGAASTSGFDGLVSNKVFKNPKIKSLLSSEDVSMVKKKTISNPKVSGTRDVTEEFSVKQINSKEIFVKNATGKAVDINVENMTEYLNENSENIELDENLLKLLI